MDAEGSIFSKRQTIIFLGQPLFIECVPRFMYTAPGHMTEVQFIDSCRYPYIIGVKAGGKRMFGDILPSCIEIESQLPDHFHTEIPLLLPRIISA